MKIRLSLVLARLFLLAACAPAAPATASVPANLVINEYLLNFGPDISTEQLVFKFASGDQEQLLAKTASDRDYRAQAFEYNRSALTPLDYTIERSQCTDGNPTGCYTISHAGKQVATDVLFMAPVSVNASRTDFITLVTLMDGTYTLTRNRFEQRPPAFQRASYLYVGDKLLSMEATDIVDGRQTVRVYLDDTLAFQTEMIPAIAPYGPTDGPWGWKGHWALAVLDGKQDAQGGIEPVNRLIVDGQDLNTLKGYEQSYGFVVLDGRPFYFYQRGGKIGISFDGEEFPQNYEEIPHYQCCSGSLLNPRFSMNMTWFFARRGRDWYYVEAYIPRP